jgi:hypothetical protein
MTAAHFAASPSQGLVPGAQLPSLPLSSLMPDLSLRSAWEAGTHEASASSRRRKRRANGGAPAMSWWAALGSQPAGDALMSRAGEGTAGGRCEETGRIQEREGEG